MKRLAKVMPKYRCNRSASIPNRYVERVLRRAARALVDRLLSRLEGLTS